MHTCQGQLAFCNCFEITDHVNSHTFVLKPKLQQPDGTSLKGLLTYGKRGKNANQEWPQSEKSLSAQVKRRDGKKEHIRIILIN